MTWHGHVNRFETILHDSHLQQGDRVGLICKNRYGARACPRWLMYSPAWAVPPASTHLSLVKPSLTSPIAHLRWEWAAAAFAAYRLGAMAVPMYESQHPDEWEYIVTNSGSRIVVASAPAARCVQGLLASNHIDRAILVDAVPELASHDGCTMLSSVAACPPRSSSPHVDPELPCQIIYTSGTTGRVSGGGQGWHCV